jgi:cell division protein FtsA
VVDDQDGIGDPVGMTGSRLEVNVHIVTCGSAAMQNVVTCVNRAGVNVRESVLEQLAASEAVLTEDEKQLGVALLDIGAGTTDIAIYERGSIWHTAVVPFGGDHFTNDIAVGLRMPIPEAEKLKRRSGCALSALVSDDQSMDVASVGGRPQRVMARRILSEVLQPRAEEVFHNVWDELHRTGYEKSLNSGIVLTGGGANLEGMVEIAEQIFDLPVRCGEPEGTGGLADHIGNPSFATAVGLLVWAGRQRSQDTEGTGQGPFGRITERIFSVFKEFF